MKKITILIFVLFVFSWQSNAQFTQGFETGIPATWTVINGGDANTWTATTPGTGTAHTGTNVAKLVFGATAHDDYLITEQFTVTAGVSDRLSLWHKQRSNTFPEPFDVLLSTGGNTAPDFTITIAAAVASNTTWQQKTYDLTAYIGGTVYIAFRSTTTDQWELYLDDIVVDGIPSCPAPTALTATNITTTAADLGWTDTSGNWDIEWGASGFTPTGIPNINDTANNPYNLGGLNSATPYSFYVRADCGMDNIDVSTWAGPFNFTTLATPPANDDCANAVALTVNADFACGSVTAGTTAGATASSQPDDVVGTPNNDVWFSFIATSTAHRVALTNVVAVIGTSTDMAIGVYNGTGGCAGLVFQADSDPNTLNLTGLTAGVTYYVRVYGFASGATTAQANFNICIGTPPAPPANDDCANAVALTVNADFACAAVTAGTTVSATASSQPDDVVGTPDNDVWFSFVATGTDHRVALTNVVAVVGTSTDMAIGVYNGTGGCAGLVFQADSDPNTLNLTGLTAGVTYYVRVYGFASGATTAQTNFNVCVGTPPPPPANDNFANAIPLTCGQNVTGSTAAATLDEDNAPDGFGADLDAPNVWFTYTGSGTSELITIDLCQSAYDTSFLVYTGTSGNLTLVGGNDDGGASGCPGNTLASFGSFVSDGTTTYYITVEGWNFSNTGTFDLTLTCAPNCTAAQANQDCASAVGINVDGNATTVDNTCATINPTQNCDSFNSIADVWYSFTAPVSGTVNVTAALGTATAVHMAVYSGTCGALVSEGCSTADPTASLTLTSLVGGNTYYLQLWNNGTEEGTFDVTLTDPSLSVGSFENNEFTYFPNPVKNTLSLRAQKEIQNVSIYNMIGQEVLRSTPNTLTDEVDMSSLQTGAYFVKVTIDNSTEVIRIVKQ